MKARTRERAIALLQQIGTRLQSPPKSGYVAFDVGMVVDMVTLLAEVGVEFEAAVESDRSSSYASAMGVLRARLIEWVKDHAKCPPFLQTEEVDRGAMFELGPQNGSSIDERFVLPAGNLIDLLRR